MIKFQTIISQLVYDSKLSQSVYSFSCKLLPRVNGRYNPNVPVNPKNPQLKQSYLDLFSLLQSINSAPSPFNKYICQTLVSSRESSASPPHPCQIIHQSGGSLLREYRRRECISINNFTLSPLIFETRHHPYSSLSTTLAQSYPDITSSRHNPIEL